MELCKRNQLKGAEPTEETMHMNMLMISCMRLDKTILSESIRTS